MSFVDSLPARCAPEPASLCFAPRPASPGCRFDLHRRDDEARRSIEQFIAAVYRQHFDARLKHFMPVLVSSSIDGATCAAAGYRSAAEPLFLERYLPQPIEQTLAAATGQRLDRNDIVEVGQFASRCAGEGRRLMLALARHLVDAGYRWAVITATADLRRLFRRQGLSALPLGTAQRRCVGDEVRLWGSYYRHAPRVLAGDLLVNLDRLERGRR